MWIFFGSKKKSKSILTLKQFIDCLEYKYIYTDAINMMMINMIIIKFFFGSRTNNNKITTTTKTKTKQQRTTKNIQWRNNLKKKTKNIPSKIKFEEKNLKKKKRGLKIEIENYVRFFVVVFWFYIHSFIHLLFVFNKNYNDYVDVVVVEESKISAPEYSLRMKNFTSENEKLVLLFLNIILPATIKIKRANFFKVIIIAAI